MIESYIKKPIPIEAVKVERQNRDELIELLKKGVTKWEEIEDGFIVHSWEGVEPVLYGSNYWIIKGIKGECYPCEGSVFEESYEKAGNSPFKSFRFPWLEVKYDGSTSSENEQESKFQVGEVVLYQNGDKFELGIVKRVVPFETVDADEKIHTNYRYFVYYHTGNTAASTNERHLHKIVNLYAFEIRRKSCEE